MKLERRDIEFAAEGEVVLRGWLYVPQGAARAPAISMAHGYGSVKEHRLDAFATRFAAAGFVVLVHDHRNFGSSDGDVRHDIDPWQQISDWRRAISFLESLPEVDEGKIGVWGSSYAGGHVLVLGATDRRIRAVVSQVPTISGYEAGRRRISPDAIAAIDNIYADDERSQFSGEAPKLQKIVSDDLSEMASYRSPDAIAYYLQSLPDGAWENKVTVRSGRLARMYEPGNWISRISPTPLLMLVARNDTLTLTDLELAAFERALQPKRLVMLNGGHFDPYVAELEKASASALDWFNEHLRPASGGIGNE